MMEYVLVLIADLLLAVTLLFQKKYQKSAGVSIKAGLAFNAITGIFSACLFFIINKFTLAVSLFSLVMAMLFSTLLVIYILIGFRIMQKGSMSLYTLFLMTGGMTLPYLWGVFFLNEELTLIRTIGLVVIISAIALSNTGGQKPDKKQLFMCIAVFFLNGAVSIVAKTHQIRSFKWWCFITRICIFG